MYNIATLYYQNNALYLLEKLNQNINMPIEQQDNTRVVLPLFIPLPSKEEKKQIYQAQLQKAAQQNQAQLWDADKVKRYQNMQNFYNNNFWGYGVVGRQTNYDPRTPQGQAAIQSNFNYAKNNAENFAENLLTAGIAEGAGQAIKWAATPTKIGAGAEAVVSSAPLSTKVTKVTTIPKSEMHLRNQVPAALKANYVGSSNGLTTYTQSKVRILSESQIGKVAKALENMMNKKGWRKVTHPNLEGFGFTNGRYVVSDLGSGNIGVDMFGRPRLVDFVIETVPNFRLTMQKKGGILVNIN